jgi:hypothetical protein
MKKLTLTLIAAFISISMFAVSDLDIHLCDEKESNSISRSHLKNCDFLSVNDANWKIQSMSIGYANKEMYKETKSLDKDDIHKFLSRIAESEATFFYVEQIVIVNKDGETKTLEPKKVKITE